MNRQEAKELLPIIQAFAEGKEIECRTKGFKEKWKKVTDIPLLSLKSFECRIKPEPKYRPFNNAEECWREMQKHKPFGWLKDKKDGYYALVTAIDNGNDSQMSINGNTDWQFSSIIDFYTFADGTPFGIKE